MIRLKDEKKNLDGPRSIDEVPAFAKAWGKLQQLRLQRDQIRQQLSELQLVDSKADRKDLVSARAEALLAGDDMHAVDEISNDTLRKLRIELDVTIHAIGLQEKRVEHEQAVAHRLVAATYEAEHRHLVATMAERLAELREVAAAYDSFKNDVEDACPSWASYLRPVPFMGRFRECVESIDRWQSEVEEFQVAGRN